MAKTDGETPPGTWRALLATWAVAGMASAAGFGLVVGDKGPWWPGSLLFLIGCLLAFGGAVHAAYNLRRSGT